MARLSTLAVALTVVALGIAPIAAQAAPPATDSRYAVTDGQKSTNVAEHIHIRTPATQTADPRGGKPRIWISMGFGF